MKRATLLAAVTADGNNLKPLVIVPRNIYETGLFSSGFTLNKALYESQENVFINMQLFNWLAREVLFPYIHKTREKLEYNA
jgi:hypothetical protein